MLCSVETQLSLFHLYERVKFHLKIKLCTVFLKFYPLLGCVYTVPDHFLSDAKVFLFARVYTVPVQFWSSSGTKLFHFPSRCKVVPDHFI